MLDKYRSLIRILFLADTPSLSAIERRRSTLGALLGIGVCALVLHAMPVGSGWLMAPIGASAVILFAISHSPLAQPWSVIGGYLLATVAGLACANAIPYPQLAAAVAVASSIWLMARLNCIHPPAGALALFIVLDNRNAIDQMGATAAMVAANVIGILLVAVLINNLVLGRRYPYFPRSAKDNRHNTGDIPPLERTSLNHEDLQSAVRTLDTFVDIKEEELVELYNLAVDHAFGRNIGLTCADIMSRDVVTVHFDTDLEEAWKQLRQHRISALPVVDSFQRLIGIVTVADFLRQMDETTAAGLAVKLQGLLRRTPGPNSDKAEVVGQIMSTQVLAARMDTPIPELVQQLSDLSMHHIPVIGGNRQVLGMVTQSDIIAALYRRLALSSQAAVAAA